MSMNTQQARVVDPVLTQYARGYRNGRFVGGTLFPRVPVAVHGGKIVEFGKDAFRLLAARRAPGAEVEQVGVRYGSQSFQLVQDAADGMVPREHMQDAQAVPKIDLGKIATKKVLDSFLLTLEADQAELATDADAYPEGHTTTLSGTDVWTDPASDPVQVIEDAKETVRRSCGIEPNRMVVAKAGFNALRFHPKIVERFKYTTSDSITADMLAAYLDLETLEVGKATFYPRDSVAGDPMQDVWGNHAVLAYVPDSPESMEDPSFGFTYTLTNHPFVEQPEWRGGRRSWAYGVTFDRAPVIVGADAGFLITGVA